MIASARNEATARRTRTLAALADTWIAASPAPDGDATARAFFAMTGTALGVPAALLDFIATLPEPARSGLLQLVDVLGKIGIAAMPRGAREHVVLPLFARVSADVAKGIAALRAISLLLAYGRADERGQNPLWAGIGFPGAPNVDPPTESPLPTLTPSAGETIEADVVVIGSGAGGSVIAGELAARGLAVVVLEAGRQFTSADFPRDELRAFAELYWRGGYQPSEDGMISSASGASLGGGTTINWTNCFPTPSWVRERWAREHGLDDVATNAFDEHLDAVLARIGANDRVSDDFGANVLLRRAATKLGLATRRALRNTDPTRFDPPSAGHMGYGDRSGSKLATTRTYLADAVRDGARIYVRSRARKILTSGGAAVGVVFEHTTPSGARVSAEVRARQIVVAGGAIETPALLLRSGIGGAAVGQNLHLHPAFLTFGLYEERVESWTGPPQTTQVVEHLDREDGWGYVVECPHFHVGVAAASIPFTTAREHKQLMQRIAHAAPFLGRVHDRGAGRVTIDGAGEAVVRYPLTDALDQKHVRDALGTLVRLHEAAGATEILDLGPTARHWKRGQSIERFIDVVRSIPFTPGARAYFSAHQMGTARMGTDRTTSVADPRGAVHDTRGVWIGDTSAFPTSTGANPMLTTMALARRTAHAIADTRNVL